MTLLKRIENVHKMWLNKATGCDMRLISCEIRKDEKYVEK